MAVIVLSLIAGSVVAIGLWLASRDSATLSSKPTNADVET